MTPDPAQPAEAWLNDPASLENGEPAQENDDVRTNTVANPDGGVGVDRGVKGYPLLRDGSMKPAQPAESPEARALRDALRRIQEAPEHLVPSVTIQRMRNIAGFALLGEVLP